MTFAFIASISRATSSVTGPSLTAFAVIARPSRTSSNTFVSLVTTIGLPPPAALPNAIDASCAFCKTGDVAAIVNVSPATRVPPSSASTAPSATAIGVRAAYAAGTSMVPVAPCPSSQAIVIASVPIVPPVVTLNVNVFACVAVYVPRPVAPMAKSSPAETVPAAKLTVSPSRTAISVPGAYVAGTRIVPEPPAPSLQVNAI